VRAAGAAGAAGAGVGWPGVAGLAGVMLAVAVRGWRGACSACSVSISIPQEPSAGAVSERRAQEGAVAAVPGQSFPLASPAGAHAGELPRNVSRGLLGGGGRGPGAASRGRLALAVALVRRILVPRHSGCRGPVDAPGRSAGVGRATCPGPATLEVGCWRQLDHEGHLACSSRESRLFTRSRPIGDSTHRSPGTFRIALAGPAGCMSLFDEHCQSPARWMCAAGGQTLLLADSCPGRPMWLRCSKFFNVFG